MSHEASSKFHRKSFQTDRFVRVFFQISQKKLAKASLAVVRGWWSAIVLSFAVDRGWWSAIVLSFAVVQLHQTPSKRIVLCDASNNFHRKSFQNDRFVRGFFEISQHKLAKRAFRAMLPTIFTEKASKTIVSCEASSKFHRTSFQKDRFVRGFRRNFTEQASKTSVSHDASDNFHRKNFQNDRFVRGFLEISQNKLPKRAFRARLLPNFIEQCLQNERFARCFRQFPQKICVWPQFRAIDPPNPTRGFIQQKQNVRLATTACHPKFQNVRFTTAACAKIYESSARRPGQTAAYKNHHFTTVSDI